MPPFWYPVFQMKLQTAGPRTGWVLADEIESKDFFSPAFTVAVPRHNIEGQQYGFPVTVNNVPAILATIFDGREFAFIYRGLEARWGLHDVLSSTMTQGLPYIGSEHELIEWYGKTDYYFQTIVPLDLVTMDRLYLEHRLAFVGVTKRFGPHLKGLVFQNSA